MNVGHDTDGRVATAQRIARHEPHALRQASREQREADPLPERGAVHS